LTFYHEDDQQAHDDLRRRNRRWIIGIVAVVTLMVISAAIGAAVASSSHSHDRVTGDNACQSGQSGAQGTPTTKAGGSGSKKSPGSSRTTLPNRVTLPGNRTLPKTVTPVTPATRVATSTTATAVTAAPASPSVKNAYVAAFRQECQSIWSHADADGLLWDPDDPSSGPHKITECYAAINPADDANNGALAQAVARDNADSAVDLMTTNSRLRSTKGVVFDLP
jgi:hypothetical protein